MNPGCPTAACVRRVGRRPRAAVDTPMHRMAVHHLTTALFLSKLVRPLLCSYVAELAPGGVRPAQKGRGDYLDRAITEGAREAQGLVPESDRLVVVACEQALVHYEGRGAAAAPSRSSHRTHPGSVPWPGERPADSARGSPAGIPTSHGRSSCNPPPARGPSRVTPPMARAPPLGNIVDGAIRELDSTDAGASAGRDSHASRDPPPDRRNAARAQHDGRRDAPRDGG